MTFQFEDFLLDPERRELRHADTLVALEPQVFDLLTYLVRNRERVVTRDNLLDAIWNGRVVSESTLTSRINAARRAVGDNGEEQRLIRTVARKGVRFVGAVTELAGAARPAGTDEPPAPPTGLPLPDRPAIAVLPFTNMSGEAGQDYFSDGISEDIITALSKLRWFFVIARNSSFIYKGRTVHLRQVAEELGVRYVVEGSVRKDGERVRITAQLNDVATGSHLWAERYDRELADVFAVQDEITEAIVAAIEPQLYAAENFRAQRKPPDSMDAWDLVMRALSHYWRVTRQDHVVAQALLEKAIALDPTYGKALGLLGTSYMFTAHMGWMDMAVALPAAERAARAAIRADDEDAWAHNALGHVHLFARRFEDSLAEFETALRLNPNFALAQGYHGLALGYCGRWQEADEAARRAIRLSPRDPYAPVYFGIAAYARFLGGDDVEAIRLAQEALRQRSDFVGAHRVLTAAAGMAGHREVAAAALRELRRAQPNVSLAWIAEFMPIKLPHDRERYLEGFRRAGLT
ncbi:winged helix-turn-helix domain-containing tetratricopeptide repeat protein [Bradyrhizobium huanghuaihaiense]|uniref:winged helix-turn-helix domain-containing tetratricopeptide repeat protein n=1 Tax=Bradyrhizobium huanghuaihaiense TaxID=990078 RepID=UPI0021AA843D|nr:winged helix-turn-helix domain-containing tetratricopeptide repeat protein [Bradyrhizobium sp. CB3035]UWU78052.1 winged helix-turn-helix domain-containing tetratricopeptide repeat protein [Bradyrhizobium sp. CB3035]